MESEATQGMPKQLKARSQSTTDSRAVNDPLTQIPFAHEESINQDLPPCYSQFQTKTVEKLKDSYIFAT